LQRIIPTLFVALLTLAIVVATIWAVLALWYRLSASVLVRGITGGLFTLIGFATIFTVFRGLLLWPLAVFVVAFGAVLA
jgi:hypothetical protein